jgi:hypothetical protein
VIETTQTWILGYGGQLLDFKVMQMSHRGWQITSGPSLHLASLLQVGDQVNHSGGEQPGRWPLTRPLCIGFSGHRGLGFDLCPEKGRGVEGGSFLRECQVTTQCRVTKWPFCRPQVRKFTLFLPLFSCTVSLIFGN